MVTFIVNEHYLYLKRSISDICTSKAIVIINKYIYTTPVYYQKGRV